MWVVCVPQTWAANVPAIAMSVCTVNRQPSSVPVPVPVPESNLELNVAVKEIFQPNSAQKHIRASHN